MDELSLVLLPSESLSLACARESNQREAHPGCHARRAMRSGFARTCRGSLNAHPCACNERARIVRAPLRAFRQARAAANGDPGSQARSKAADMQFGNRRPERSQVHLPTCRKRGALDVGSLCVAAAAAAMPDRGGARDRADSAVGTRMCRQRNTGRGRGLFGAAEKRNAKGVFFGLPFLHEQER